MTSERGIQLKVGQRYKDRNGDVWFVYQECADSHSFDFKAYLEKCLHCDCDEPEDLFLANGCYEEDGTSSEWDLVELIEGANPQAQ